MLKTNEDQLIMLSVIGEVSSPVTDRSYKISHDGEPKFLPGVGGVTYNVKIGDCVCGWQADHVEPGVSIANTTQPIFGRHSASGALNVFSQIGNEAKIITGDAKGKKGIVTGKHGGVEHVLADFEDKTLEELVIGDKVMIKSYGLGLELLDYPNIKVMNLSPDLLKKIPIKKSKNKLKIPVTHKVPAKIMGSGLGAAQCYSGDYDIQLFDKKIVEEYGLESLRFGDIVAITDADHSYGRIYKTGAVSIGVVVHSDCILAGHGPGVTTIFTSSEGEIQPVIDSESNIGFYLKIGRYRE